MITHHDPKHLKEVRVYEGLTVLAGLESFTISLRKCGSRQAWWLELGSESSYLEPQTESGERGGREGEREKREGGN